MHIECQLDYLSEDIFIFMDKYWKPNQDDAFIVVEKSSDKYEQLLKWFTKDSDVKINVGPFVGISAYGFFDVEDNPDRCQFLFIYDSIDNTKLEQHHLALV